MAARGCCGGGGGGGGGGVGSILRGAGGAGVGGSTETGRSRSLRLVFMLSVEALEVSSCSEEVVESGVFGS